MATSPPSAEIPASGGVPEVPVRELRNRTRDVMQLVEQGWTVYSPATVAVSLNSGPPPN